MVTLFWLLAALVFYVYVGYPLLLHVWARIRPKRIVFQGAGGSDAEPSVSFVIASRNEGHRIPGRINNLR